jgi:hypothetical protein
VNWLLVTGAVLGVLVVGAVWTAQFSMAQPFMAPVPIAPNWAVELVYMMMVLTAVGAVVLLILAWFQK